MNLFIRKNNKARQGQNHTFHTPKNRRGQGRQTDVVEVSSLVLEHILLTQPLKMNHP